MKKLLAYSCFALLSACQTHPDMNAIGIRLSDASKAERNSFSTYITFLSSRNFDSNQTRQERTKILKNSFYEFAQGIGNESAAIWAAPPFETGGQEISKKIHDKYNLDYSGGPFVLITKTHPLSNTNIEDGTITLNFSNTNPDRIQNTLDYIQQHIRKNDINAANLVTTHSREIIISTLSNNSEVVKEIFLKILKK